MKSNFTYKPTTAYWKIDKLIKEGLPQFKKDEKKVFVIEGGQGAGKTISILMMIIDLFARSEKKMTVCTAQSTKLKDTAWKDFNNILKDWNIPGYNKTEQPMFCYKDRDSHFVEFVGLDKDDMGKGRRRDVIYINEANKISLKQFTDISARGKVIIIDFNPDSKFWGHDLINDFNFIRITYPDNEFLPQAEISNILDYKVKGFIDPYIEDYDKPSNIKNEYWANKWRVYGLGKPGGVEGRIFNWKKIGLKEYLDIQGVPTIYTVDWGKQDPFAIGEMKYYDGMLLNHELNYMSENEWRKRLTTTQLAQIQGRDNDGFITWMFERLNIPKDAYIICDSNRPEKIKSLRKAGWTYAVAIDGSSKVILDGIDLLHNLDVRFTDTSTNIDNEQQAYSWDKDKNENQLEKPKDQDNHHMDRIRYGAMWWAKKGVIKKV